MLSKFSVNKPFTIVVAVIVILVLGFVAFGNMTTDLLPDINLPYVVVVTSYAGATPEEVELTVSKPVEQALATTSNVKNVMSVSMENMSMVILEFYQDTDMDSVTLEMRENLDLVESVWDNDLLGSPMIIKLNPNMIPLMMATVDVEGYTAAETSTLFSDRLQAELESVEGVASVTSIGLVTEDVKVTISKEKLDALNDRIFAAIDGDLNKARAAINSARGQLNAAAGQLETQLAQQTAALNEGKNQLAAGQQQLDQAAGDLQTRTADLQARKDTLTAALSEMNSQRSALAEQAAAIEALGSAATAEQRAQLTQLQTTIAALDGKIAEAQAGLDQVEQGLQQCAAGQAELDEQQKTLDAQAAELGAAEQTLQSEGAKARAQLDSGRAQINSQAAQINSAGADAKEQADVSNIITAEMVEGILAAQNFSMPAGAVDAGSGDQSTVKVGNKIGSVEELESLLLFNMDMESIGNVYLSDVAEIEQGDNSGEVYAKINGNDGVLLAFQKQSAYSTAAVCESIRDKIAELEGEYEGLSILPLMDQGEYIEIVTDSVLQNLLIGAILAILILLLFLRNLKPTILVAVSIPASVLFAIVMMYFSGVTLNIISLSGLALGVGMLVDNSIVVIENIYRLRSTGVPAREAAIEGAKQVAGAITASTLTTICVFVPILFTNGLAKELFIDMGLTIAYSLIASLLVALTLVPALGASLLRNVEYKESRFFAAFKAKYVKLLQWTLGHRALTLIIVVVLFVGSIAGAVTAGTSFMPEADSLELSATVTMNDEEATTDELWAMSDEVMARIMENEDIEAVGAIQAGDESFMSTGTESGMSFYILLKDDKTMTNKEVAADIVARCADLDCEVTTVTSSMDMSAMGGAAISISIKGDDVSKLQELAIDLEGVIGGVEGTTDVSDTEATATDELLIAVNKDMAMAEELTVAQVYSVVAAATATAQSPTTLTMDSRDYPVIVVDETAEEWTTENIGQIVVKEGEDDEDDVTVSDLADISVQKSAAAISRLNQQRYATISANVADGYNLGQVAAAVETAVDAYELPPGYSVEMTGQSVTTADTIEDLLLAIALGALLIYLIMVAQFQSLLSPFIVMFTVPLAFTGGFLALLITGKDVSVIAMLGLLVLCGIIVNNGIVLVDYINRLRREGRSKREALVEGGLTRMRPVLMTAVTTVLGLVPLGLGIGMGAEMVQPMALVTIGGMIYATALTLLVVPVIYDLFNREKKHPDEEEPAPAAAEVAAEPEEA